MVQIQDTSSLNRFRKYVIFSTCKLFISSNYDIDSSMFPGRNTELGDIYVELVDKLMIRKLIEITFVNAKEMFGINYSSKTRNTILKRRQLKNKEEKAMDEASASTLANLTESTGLTKSVFERYLKSQEQGKGLVM